MIHRNLCSASVTLKKFYGVEAALTSEMILVKPYIMNPVNKKKMTRPRFFIKLIGACGLRGNSLILRGTSMAGGRARWCRETIIWCVKIAMITILYHSLVFAKSDFVSTIFRQYNILRYIIWQPHHFCRKIFLSLSF